MAKTFVSEGKSGTWTVPAGGVVSGTPVKIGQLFVIPQVTNATVGAKFVGDVQGVHDIPKVAAEPWTEGMLVYWNTGSNLASLGLGGHAADRGGVGGARESERDGSRAPRLRQPVGGPPHDSARAYRLSADLAGPAV